MSFLSVLSRLPRPRPRAHAHAVTALSLASERSNTGACRNESPWPPRPFSHHHRHCRSRPGAARSAVGASFRTRPQAPRTRRRTSIASCVAGGSSPCHHSPSPCHHPNPAGPSRRPAPKGAAPASDRGPITRPVRRCPADALTDALSDGLPVTAVDGHGATQVRTERLHTPIDGPKPHAQTFGSVNPGSNPGASAALNPHGAARGIPTMSTPTHSPTEVPSDRSEAA